MLLGRSGVQRLCGLGMAAVLVVGVVAVSGLSTAAGRLTVSRVNGIMSTFHEVTLPEETFALPPSDAKAIVTTPGGNGGVLSAVAVVRFPTADGYGALIAFFRGSRFLGLAEWREVPVVDSIKGDGPGKFAVTYGNYPPNAPMVGDSAPPVRVVYTVTGDRIAASPKVPKSVFNGLDVPVYRGPSAAELKAVMATAKEVGTPGEHMAPVPNLAPVIVKAPGGMVTAALGVRWPTADGYGQIVFFFHGTRFISVNALKEAVNILAVRAAGPDRIAVKYADYKPTDPLVAPSLPPFIVTYRYTAGRMVASSKLPSGVFFTPHPLRVTKPH